MNECTGVSAWELWNHQTDTFTSYNFQDGASISQSQMQVSSFQFIFDAACSVNSTNPNNPNSVNHINLSTTGPNSYTYTRTESRPPYYLYGDNSGGTNVLGQGFNWPKGQYTVTASVVLNGGDTKISTRTFNVV